MSRDKVEVHFDAPRVLANLFKQMLAESEWSSMAEFFRFCMMEFVRNRKLSTSVRDETKTRQEKESDF